MEIVTAILALWGGLFLLWCAAGFLLCSCREENTVTLLRLFGDVPELERQVRRCRWLRSVGLSAGPVLLLDCGMTGDARKRAELLCRDDAFVHLLAEGDLLTYFDFTRADHGTGI